MTAAQAAKESWDRMTRPVGQSVTTTNVLSTTAVNVPNTATTSTPNMATTSAPNMVTTSEVGNMEIDPIPSGSSGSIHAPPRSPEIRVLTKEEKISLLVEAHIVLWNQCVAAQSGGATDELKTLLNSAQDSQKALQKLIKKDEVEEFTKGWNPWEIKKQLFPNTNKGKGKAKNNGNNKAQSSASKSKVYYHYGCTQGFPPDTHRAQQQTIYAHHLPLRSI
ncbi:hypothetical protein Pst134EA_013291 [Puccinia striiformis f. sp. tritici]|uniref:Uncharacterized protein n=1 Tax=Puccinia striiformis f. sp. tritici PST-78 TaxID=1165861 RepID=A0A0L0VBP7_9BASI|nr:hypothetical protein Pst134EA_013291 [Puccinia striiformis f. sp. tritici]KAH9465408.1 hypothetical protein Pst134EA_013291 [Puccinia striiformis f. sp. tritici]KNE96737.1 hypothetical protein PSTG_10008 [Puccinia striiformis f. sp. tritici PST-78]